MEMRLLDADNKFIGILPDDFEFAAKTTCNPAKVAFYKGPKHLFSTDFNVPKTIFEGDILRVKLDSGINFYYLATKVREPLRNVEQMLTVWRSLREIVRRLKHERQARDQLSTWDQQIYEVLFNEKQQPVSRRDTGLLVQRDLEQFVDRVQVFGDKRAQIKRSTKPISPAIPLDKNKKG
jgi:hypothetical protein